MKLKVAQLYLTLCDPMDYTVHRILQARILEWVAFPLSSGSSQPRDQIQVSHIAVDSLPAEPQGKPKTTGVGHLSLLQQIFPSQELNQALLHAGRFFTSWAIREAHIYIHTHTHIIHTHIFMYAYIQCMYAYIYRYSLSTLYHLSLKMRSSYHLKWVHLYISNSNSVT